MDFYKFCATALFALAIPMAAHAQDQNNDHGMLSIGGDEYIGGNSATISAPVKNDGFAVGNDVIISANVFGDVHAMGNTINISGDVAMDVYIAGNEIDVSGSIGQDASIAGNKIVLNGQSVGGNVRAVGRLVTVEAPVKGSAIVVAQTLILNTTITGDLNFTGAAIEFGAGAKVAGNVLVQSDNEIDVPTSVAAANRVTFVETQMHEMAGEAGKLAEDTTRNVIPGFIPGLGFLVALFAVGMIYLALMRKNASSAYQAFSAKPFRSLFIGLFTLSAYVGLGIVLLFTLIGIPLAPIAFMWLALMVFVGFATGAFFIARRVFEAFGQDVNSLGMQALALAAGLALIWVLGFLPFLGWSAKVMTVFLGLGGMSLAFMYRQSAPKELQEQA